VIGPKLLADLDWLSVVERLGFPAAFLVALAYAAWQVCKFFGPKLTDLFSAQNQLVATLNDQIPRQTEILQSQGQILSQHGQILEQHGELLTNVYEIVKESRGEHGKDS
jgi:ABC-type transporter Mla subunit MlaD